MTEAMPFLQKAILLSYAPRPFGRDFLFQRVQIHRQQLQSSFPILRSAGV